MLRYTNSVEESKSLNGIHGPMIIISASGMCEFGRVLHHLNNNLADPKNLVLIPENKFISLDSQFKSLIKKFSNLFVS